MLAVVQGWAGQVGGAWELTVPTHTLRGQLGPWTRDERQTREQSDQSDQSPEKEGQESQKSVPPHPPPPREDTRTDKGQQMEGETSWRQTNDSEFKGEERAICRIKADMLPGLFCSQLGSSMRTEPIESVWRYPSLFSIAEPV